MTITRGPADQRQRDRHALLLAAAELVRIAALERLVVGQLRLARAPPRRARRRRRGRRGSVDARRSRAAARPMRRPGLRPVAGSCGTYAMSRPRRRRRSRSASASEVDVARCGPRRRRSACRGARSRAAPARRSSCPSPDSPTMPSVSPRRERQVDVVDDVDAPSTLVDAQVATRRAPLARRGAGASMRRRTRRDGHQLEPAARAPARPRRRPSSARLTPIMRTPMRGDGRRRTAHGCEREPGAVLADDQAPVGGRRLEAEAEEAEAGDEHDRRRRCGCRRRRGTAAGRSGRISREHE